MHSLALNLHRLGHQVSGSDDEIYEPARTRLRQAGILPEYEGWQPERITTDLDLVVLGMHARADNPELQAAQELRLQIQSFPELIAAQSQNKTRVVVAGSHGKTTTTAAIMHALRKLGRTFDYMVGASVGGFDHQVQLSDAPVIVLEGDEYLTSVLDPRPKFMHYRPHICIITGISWDHMNVFPTLDSYEAQFRALMGSMPSGSSLIINAHDPRLVALASASADHLNIRPYRCPEYEPGALGWKIKTEGGSFGTQLLGQHNMSNLAAAARACSALGIGEAEFFGTMHDFSGPSRRLELLATNAHSAVYVDFAHAPSKVKATIEAVREHFPERRLVAVLELHTYSSLSREFLINYRDTAVKADTFIVLLNAHAMQQKRLLLTPDDVIKAFARSDTIVVTSGNELMTHLTLPLVNSTLLMMSSGNFDGMDLKRLAILAIS